MTDEVDVNGALLPDYKRIPRAGLFLRKYSLDELPQLFNVLKGDMSLVGPRPLHPEYTKLYTVHQARRLNVKPGVTGLVQVSGRNGLSWEEKFDLDVEYVEGASLLLDLKILVRTFFVVFGAKGVNQSGEETMPRFIGSKKDINLKTDGENTIKVREMSNDREKSDA